MTKTIILLVESPFSLRDYDRFGVDILSKYFEVAVLDLTAWIKPHVWEKNASLAKTFPGYQSVSKFFEFKEALHGRTDIAFDFLGRGYEANLVRDILRQKNVPRAIEALGLIPALPPKSFWGKLLSLRFRTNKILVLWSWLVRLLSSPFQNIRNPDFALVSGTASLEVPGVRSARQIWAHSFDYDVFLKIRESARNTQRPYVVYTDEDCAYHSDFLHDHMKPLVQAANFYPALMRFFKKFEEETGLEVVIAAHPRSRWDLHGKFLEGRIPIKGKTAELISGASLVFAHASTSISYAVLFRVPLALLTSNEMNLSAYQEELAVRSEIFNVKPININDEQSGPLGNLLQMDLCAYDDYRQKYIKRDGTPDIPCWEIFAAHMLKERLTPFQLVP